MEAAPSIHAAILTVDIGDTLLSRPDVIALTYAIDGTGPASVYTPVDLSAAPLPMCLGTLSAVSRF